jgi:glycerol-3-phosphate dehydrogenase (NAD(P)+)
MAKVAILGTGGWGTALAQLCVACSHQVVFWGKFQNEVENLKINLENPLLPGVKIDNSIRITTDITDAADADIAIIATPSFAIRETAEKLSGVLSERTIVVSVSKGLEKGTMLRFSQVIKQELPNNPVVVLSGPSHAEEVAREIPTSVVAASDDIDAAKTVQQALSSERFRIYTNTDVIGVEIGAALKNIIAMAAGIIDGLGLGDNTIAALITRGINEMAELGVKMGADRKTFSGLSGIGDLVVTCTSRHSRNRRFGRLLGEGKSVDEALTEVGMTVESYYATACAYSLAKKYGVEMPIINECYRVLYQDGDLREAITSLMRRKFKHE